MFALSPITLIAMRRAALQYVVSKMHAHLGEKVSAGFGALRSAEYWREFEDITLIRLGTSVTCEERSPGFYTVGYVGDKEDMEQLRV